MERTEREGRNGVHVPSVARYLQQHVLGRCGRAVTQLAAAGLIEWPALQDGEREVHEWWLVSDELAGRLERAGQPVLRFGELNMWGRGTAGGELREDLDLAGALRG
jgi:hypothetical protein